MSVDGLKPEDLTLGQHTDVWEKILHRLSLGEMPPKGAPRPNPAEIDKFTGWLEGSLDSYAMAHPDPGRATLRRMNRAEYAAAVRDLLNVNMDLTNQLPADDSGYGFDNIADILTVSPTLMDRYVSVAGKVARQAVGTLSRNPFIGEYAPPKGVNVMYHGFPSYNERSSADLPLDSRGGGVYRYEAPYDGAYLVQVVLNANTLEDNEVRASNTYEVKVQLRAGMRLIGASFPKTFGLDETPQKLFSGVNGSGQPGIVVPDAPPTDVSLNLQVDGQRVKSFTAPSYVTGKDYFQNNFPRDIVKIVVKGPYDIKGQATTPSQKRIFVCRPSRETTETACAREILTRLAGQAYRRPVTASDIAPLMRVYEASRKGTDFEHGVEGGVQAILVSPQFLFMQERTPPKLQKALYRINDLELATRLSFFLWSSLPDEKLLKAAEQGSLHKPDVLRQQIARMIADKKADAIATNFAGQWLYLRDLDYQRPDILGYPSFDERLRSSMLSETNMFFMSVFRDNSSVLNFIDSDYTFLNQRLAEHYGIPGVYGDALRRVKLDPAWHRGGLLGQGSVLTVTSFNNRTSTVRRGKWILDNILVAPPPPPPPDVPALNDEKNGKTMTVRQQMEAHRSNPVCASCHTKIDPLGFSLENYDAIGAWRTRDAGQALDVSAVMPDGFKFDGVAGLKTVLMNRKDQFVEGFVERLMTYALGRGLEPQDMPAVRAVRRKAAADGYKADTIIQAIVESVPFQMRKPPGDASKPLAPNGQVKVAQK